MPDRTLPPRAPVFATEPTLTVGEVFKGKCDWRFGAPIWSTKRVEGCGVDWLVARDEDGRPSLAAFADNSEMMDMVATWREETARYDAMAAELGDDPEEALG